MTQLGSPSDGLPGSHKPVKINIGAGGSGIDGWVNIDASWNIYLSKLPRAKTLLFRMGMISERTFRAEWKGTYVHRDVRRGLPFKNDSVSEIYCSHMLEHLPRADAMSLLREFSRVLRHGGVVRIVVPDLRDMATKYLSGASCVPGKTISAEEAADDFMDGLKFYHYSESTFLERIFGRQTPHRWMYDAESLSSRLRQAGFKEVQSFLFRRGRLSDLESIEIRAHSSIYIEAYK